MASCKLRSSSQFPNTADDLHASRPKSDPITGNPPSPPPQNVISVGRHPTTTFFLGRVEIAFRSENPLAPWSLLPCQSGERSGRHRLYIPGVLSSQVTGNDCGRALGRRVLGWASVLSYRADRGIPDAIVKFMMIVLSGGMEHSTSLTTAGARGVSQGLDCGVRL